MSNQYSQHVVVIGGGPIGLSIAWRLRQRGLKTTVVDAHEDGAWNAAAGMLGPVSEAEFGEDDRLRLALKSASIFPQFCSELDEASGVDAGYRDCGTLFVARDQDDARELNRLFNYRRSLGLEVDRLLPSEARRIEQALAPSVQLALSIPSDNVVEPKRLIAALAIACQRAGVQFLIGSPVIRINGESNGGSTAISGVTLKDGQTVPCNEVVLAAGAWSNSIEGSPLYGENIIRPVKGQSISLVEPESTERVGISEQLNQMSLDHSELCHRTIRTTSAYLVSRGSGRYLLGGTVEESGWNGRPTVEAVYELIRDISEVLPGILELEIERINVGFRPGVRDNLPIIGATAQKGLTIATGHFRNGILLAPITAEVVADIVCGEKGPDWIESFSPERFQLLRRSKSGQEVSR